jgi:hypothetical protein
MFRLSTTGYMTIVGLVWKFSLIRAISIRANSFPPSEASWRGRAFRPPMKIAIIEDSQFMRSVTILTLKRLYPAAELF